MGFFVHGVRINHTLIQMADVAGQDSMRMLWSVMYHAAHGVIYVIDGTDLERLPLAMAELKKVMEYPSLEDKPFLILMNKHDRNAMDVRIMKPQIHGDRWRAFNVSVKTGEGIDEAMIWFHSNLT